MSSYRGVGVRSQKSEARSQKVEEGEEVRSQESEVKREFYLVEVKAA